MSDKEQDGSQDNDVKDLHSQSSSRAIPAQEDLLPFKNTKQEDFVYPYPNVKPFDRLDSIIFIRRKNVGNL